MMHKGTGVLRYSHTDRYGWRLVLDIDPGISLFYRSLIPKWKTANPQAAWPHITIIRREQPFNTTAWGRYEGEVVEFLYDPYIETDGHKYWWLNCYSKRLEEIAAELGVQFIVHPGYAKPVKGFRKVWHTTIANMKPIVMQERKRKKK
jgi:hypothetical protein